MFYHNSFAIDENVKTPLTELSVLEVGFSFVGGTARIRALRDAVEVTKPPSLREVAAACG